MDMVNTYLKDCELLMATEKYSLYINRKTKEVAIYNGVDDIWSIELDELGDVGFE